MNVGAKITPKSAQRSVIFGLSVKNNVQALFFRPKLRNQTAFPWVGRGGKLCRELYDRLKPRAPCSQDEAASRSGVRRSLMRDLNA
jgi:hypothetical protein